MAKGKQYNLVNGLLLKGGFAKTGFSGVINEHITEVEKVSDTEVKIYITDEYGTDYVVTVTATIPEESGEPNKKKRTDFTYTITEAES